MNPINSTRQKEAEMKHNEESSDIPPESRKIEDVLELPEQKKTKINKKESNDMSDASGCISLNHEFMEHPFYFNDKFSRFQAWLDLLLLATWPPTDFMCRGTLIELKSGQLAIPQATLAKRWQWSRFATIRYLKFLEKRGEIAQDRTHGTNIITICNYDPDEAYIVQEFIK